MIIATETGALLPVVTIRAMRRALEPPAASTGAGYKDHPLYLPARPGSAVKWDFSVLPVALPPLPRVEPRAEAAKMTLPLAELWQHHDLGQMPGVWEYDWYYFELLDRDERVRPLCWVSSRLLYRFYAPRGGPVHLAGHTPFGPGYSRQLRMMDQLAVRAAGTRPGDIEDREEWLRWFEETWRKHERRWLRSGNLVVEPVRPWTRMLVYDARLNDEAGPSRRRRRRRPLPEWLRKAAAGPPGLYWKMVPLYDFRQASRVWSAMTEDVFATSVFNPVARVRHDPSEWNRLKARFVNPLGPLTDRRVRSVQRDREVLEWTRAGKSLTEIAELLVDTGLHHLDAAKAEPPDAQSAEVRQMYLDAARAAAARIRTRLHKLGLLERGKPGRRAGTGSKPKPRTGPDVGGHAS